MVFWLRATPATIVGRIGDDNNRPSLTGTKSFTEEVEEVLARRWPLYERLAHAAVDTDGRTPEDLAAAIVRRFHGGTSV
jgi:shikimate kinase